jgi:hypothetical protein
VCSYNHILQCKKNRNLDNFWHRKLTLKVRILPFLTTFTQLTASLNFFLRDWLLILGLNEGLVEWATVCVKSGVILTESNEQFDIFKLITGFCPIYKKDRKISQFNKNYMKYALSRHLPQVCSTDFFSNFSCMFLNPNNFF